MKNKVQVVFVFVYILLFFLIYQNFIEQDESNLHNLFGGIEKYERGGLVFNQSIDQTQISDIIDKSIELSKKENIATIVTTVVRTVWEINCHWTIMWQVMINILNHLYQMG